MFPLYPSLSVMPSRVLVDHDALVVATPDPGISYASSRTMSHYLLDEGGLLGRSRETRIVFLRLADVFLHGIECSYSVVSIAIDSIHLASAAP